jgi:hypothetical protein
LSFTDHAACMMRIATRAWWRNRRLGRALLRLRCLPAATSAASWPAWFAATVCSRSSNPNCSSSALNCSERRPNRWRSRRWISMRSLSFSACSSPCGMCYRGHHIPQHLLQRGRVVRQSVEVDLHLKIVGVPNSASVDYQQSRKRSLAIATAGAARLATPRPTRAICSRRWRAPGSNAGADAAASIILSRVRRRQADVRGEDCSDRSRLGCH